MRQPSLDIAFGDFIVVRDDRTGPGFVIARIFA